MNCECGETEGLNTHVIMPTGYISLSKPTCAQCRQKSVNEMESVWEYFQQKITESEASKNVLL